ncbi:F0F1 ATP synthase subunit B [Pantoea sp. Aalb]|uniref:F0F1 ATP synthase subunit B n=1 Tax=Pantoea sp. Aalb TaxID=2576762 RepID=UPI00132592A8|nr:F0F1 ATP synthase subunit B [Pantoea sp. Aalb]MXP67615.1 F0F1 ATP synthase subunit B [Pantoea sp. Aalb]
MNINATILGQVIAFIVFVAFCMKYVWPPIIFSIERRQKEITEAIEFSERAKKDLYLAKINATAELKKAKDKSIFIIEEANKRRIQIIEEAKTEAKLEHNRIVSQAQLEIEVERLRVYEELRKQISLLTLVGTEKIIEHVIDESTNRKIIDKLLAEL